MKKLLTLAISFVFALPFVASAASFVVTPSSGSYTAGNTITLNIAVNPSGSTVYTAMLDARFSPEVFEVVSFSLNDAMLPLKQPGYDALNNSAGVLTKTGGYTGGVSSETPFGTLVLRAKGSGVGTLNIADSSKLLDSNNTDQQSGVQTISFSIASKAPAVVKTTPAQVVVVQKKVAEPEINTVVETPALIVNNEIATVNEPKESIASTQLAAVAGTGATNSVLLWVLGFIVVLSIFCPWYFTRTRRSRSLTSK